MVYVIQVLQTACEENQDGNYRTRNRGLNMGPRKSQINHKHRYLNKKGENYTNVNKTLTKELFPNNKN